MLFNLYIQIGRLRDLLKMATDPLFLKSKQLCQLLIASLCVVFKDVLPAYKIRLPSEQELQQKVSYNTLLLLSQCTTWFHKITYN